eukprot:scaffold93489_cov27-Tisochrysis_lutea.AAC.2
MALHPGTSAHGRLVAPTAFLSSSLIILVALLVIYDTIRQRHMHRAEQSGDDKVNPDTKPMERANLEQTCI